MSSYPIELKLAGRTVVVVGLGPVGRHKAAGLVAAGARVIGVDPAAGDLDQAALDGIELVAKPYRAEQLYGASLVIAAGPDEVNGRVVADARQIGAWVCSTSDPDAGDFTVPAVWRSGRLVLTVSTSGASPALASALRDRAAQRWGRLLPGWPCCWPNYALAFLIACPIRWPGGGSSKTGLIRAGFRSGPSKALMPSDTSWYDASKTN